MSSLNVINNIKQPVLAAYPEALYIELTDRCNLSCPMCRSAGFRGDVLPFDTYLEISETLFPHAKFIDLRGWGESTLLKNFESYLDVALKYDAKIKLITNATVNKPALWEKMGREGVLTGVSFDAATEETFSRLRGGASMKKVIQNLTVLKEAYEHHNHSVPEHLYFCVTVSGDNLDQLAGIIDIGVSLGINHFKFEPLKTSDSDPGNLLHFTEKTKQVLKDLATMVKLNAALKLELSASFNSEHTNRAKTKKFCIHPFTYLYVNSKGGLGFCDHLNGVEEFVWGKWNGLNGFKEFWLGEKMNRLRKEHLKVFNGERISSCADCNWCYERRYADMEYLVDNSWHTYSELIL